VLEPALRLRYRHLVQPPGQAVVRDLHIRKDYLEEVRRGMELVTSNHPHATASLLVLEGANAGIKIAAKTGTSEWGTEASRASYKTPDHAWMIGYAPADNPTVAFACFIHSGTFGGKACTPVVKRILERYFSKYGHAGHAAKNGATE
jgi:penicillin-binding protein 2